MHANRTIPICLAFFFFLLIGVDASGQNAPNSLTPGKNKEVSSMLQTKTTTAKKKRKTAVFSPRRQNVKHTARYEFYERIEQAAKDKQRIMRKLAKPQYSDPRYFGHKRIPKRRPANKMRYCGECGIRH